MKSTAKRLAVVLMALAMVVALPGVALAHHPEIVATPDCMLADGSWYLDYTATAWVGDGSDASRTHGYIDISVDGAVKATGAFSSPDFSFSGKYLVRAGITQVVVRAEARLGMPWGNRYLPTQWEFTETTVAKPTKPCVENPGTGTPGYWHKIEHWDDWGLTEVTVGGFTYPAARAIRLINLPVKGDKTLTMFPALVAAVLNVEIGNDPSCIEGTIAAANRWMAAYPPRSGVKGKDRAWKIGEPFYKMLDKYNNGYLCAPHRD